MEKVTFVIITLILTSVIVQESTGKITIVMHHGNIRHRPTKKQNRHSVEDSKGSKTSKKPQRPRHLINKLMKYNRWQESPRRMTKWLYLILTFKDWFPQEKRHYLTGKWFSLTWWTNVPTEWLSNTHFKEALRKEAFLLTIVAHGANINPFTPMCLGLRLKKIDREKKVIFSFCKILDNRQHHEEELLNSFHLNGHTLGFHPQLKNKNHLISTVNSISGQYIACAYSYLSSLPALGGRERWEAYIFVSWGENCSVAFISIVTLWVFIVRL